MRISQIVAMALMLFLALPVDASQLIIRYKDGSMQRVPLEGPPSRISQITISEGEGEAYSGRINVVAGSYGMNCGAHYGNKTKQLASACNGREFCSYRIDVGVLGDPAVGCEKEYAAEWRCSSGPVKTLRVPPEAGRGSVITLTCP